MSLSDHSKLPLNHYMSQGALLAYMSQLGGTLAPKGYLSLDQLVDQAVVQAFICPQCQGPLTYLPFCEQERPARHLASVAWCETCQYAKAF